MALAPFGRTRFGPRIRCRTGIQQPGVRAGRPTTRATGPSQPRLWAVARSTGPREENPQRTAATTWAKLPSGDPLSDHPHARAPDGSSINPQQEGFRLALPHPAGGRRESPELDPLHQAARPSGSP
ncbi:hypothetical protein BRADI_3g06095v3 [Brachypodium distachyon]|uniref:Uncharacterized protein n=1 Tax=Brachypodium distachyon TaxID=15368 RepID=A0A0Q3F2L7_BRADI|nr:hypothetical protein BRADI_3g06095v3 [Brachypodium distachyon]